MSYMFKVTESIDKIQWSKYVLDHPNGNIFQTPEMYTVYERTKNYEPFTLAILNEGDNIVALLQAVIIKTIGGPLGFLTSRAIIQGGPLWKEDEEGEEAVKLLMFNYNKIITHKVIYTEFRNIYDISKISSLLYDIGYKYEDHLNFLIDLKKTKEELWASLSKSRKRGVKSAKKDNLTIEIGRRESIPIIYSFLKETHDKIKIPIVDISIFEAVYDILVPKNMAEFLLVKLGNEYIGGRVLLHFDKQAYAWYRSTKNGFSNYYPNDLMGWDIIERYHEKGYCALDLGGAGKPDKEYGVRDFKKQFGGDLVNYGRYRKDHHPKILKLSMKAFQLYKNIKR